MSNSRYAIVAVIAASLVAGCGNSTPVAMRAQREADKIHAEVEAVNMRAQREDGEARAEAEYEATAWRKAERSRAARVARRERERRTAKASLLGGKEAVGMRLRDIRRRLGTPSHMQEIGGTRYWYYIEGSTEWQLIAGGDIVEQVNRY